MNRKDTFLLLREWKVFLNETRETAIESEVQVIFPDIINSVFLNLCKNFREKFCKTFYIFQR